MTRFGRRRTVPALLAVVTATLVSVLAVVVGSAGEPAAAPDTAPSAVPMAVGPQLLEAAPPNPPQGSPLLLPLPPPIPPPIPPIPPVPLPPRPPAPPPPPPRPLLSGPALQIVTLTNAQRARAGCTPLRIDPRLNVAAQKHSQNMAKQDFFSHSDPAGNTFRERERTAGYPSPGGENIARGQRTAAEVMADWMGSPGHRRNILDCAFTTIGVGYVAAGHYWTQNFGR